MDYSLKKGLIDTFFELNDLVNDLVRFAIIEISSDFDAIRHGRSLECDATPPIKMRK